MNMKKYIHVFCIITALLLALVSVCSAGAEDKMRKPVLSTPGQLEKAVLAGGCFWCMEAPFDKLPGVVSVTPGYTGGQKKNPTYKEVSAGGTGHAEAVQIVYDPAKISYDKLLAVYWHNIDPTVKNRQFCDSGDQYRSAIFYTSEEQRRIALQSKDALEKNKHFRETVMTEISCRR